MRVTCVILAALLISPASSLHARETGRFDLSYFSNADLAQARARRDAIAAALGPEVGARLRVVRSDSVFLVVYLRSGSSEKARLTAATHSRILTARNLGSAGVVPTRAWVEVPKGVKAPAPAPAAQTPAAAPAAPPPEPSPATQPPAAASVPPAQTAPAAQAPTAEPAAPLAAASASAPPAAVAPAPAPAPAPAKPAMDPKQRQWLESVIEARMKNLRREGRLASDERTAWSVYDFTTEEKLVEINADIKLQAASLIKPFVVLAYLHQVEQAKLPYDDLAKHHMERMIQHSDNRSTNWTLQRLGGPAATQKILKAGYGNILKDLELVEAIPPGGRTYRNKASAADYSRFLLALWKNELPRSEEIKRLMALPKRDRISTGTEVPQDSGVLSKTGSTRHLCGDMGLILARGPDGREYPYALIGIIEKKSAARHYLRWLHSRGNIIREVSSLIYRTIGELHGFTPTQLASR